MRAAAALAIVFGLAPGGARADVNQLFGSTPRPLSLAGAYTAIANDPSALYYNPAGLSQIDGVYAELSTLLSVPRLRVAAPGGSMETLDLDTDDGYGLYLGWNPREVLDGCLGIGFSTLLPHRRALRFSIHRAEDPYFVLYENTIELLEMRIGVAYRFFDLFSVGVSALLLAGLNGAVQIEAPFQSDEIDPAKRTVLALDVVLPNREFLTAGIQFFPARGLTLGLSYREATYVPVTLPIDFTVQIFAIDLPTVANLEVAAKYSPAQLTFGAAYQLDGSLLLTADLTFADYSSYQLPFGDVAIDVSRLSPDIKLLPPKRPKLSLRNVWMPRFGVEWTPIPELALRGGYWYARSFVRSAEDPVLDSDKHAFAFGAGYAFDRLLFGTPTKTINLLAATQLMLYVPRTTALFEHGGLVWSSSLSVELKY